MRLRIWGLNHIVVDWVGPLIYGGSSRFVSNVRASNAFEVPGVSKAPHAFNPETLNPLSWDLLQESLRHPAATQNRFKPRSFEIQALTHKKNASASPIRPTSGPSLQNTWFSLLRLSMCIALYRKLPQSRNPETSCWVRCF